MGERKKDKLLKSLAVANSFHALAERWFEHWSHAKDEKTVSAARGRLDNYIIPQLVGPSGLYIGSMVYTMQGTIGNIPMAAAFTCVPIVLITIYLSIARKLGAFNAL